MVKTRAVKVPFTKAVLENLAAPSSGRTYYYDERTPGLALCVTDRGTRTFYYYRKVNGRPMRVRVGGFPELSPEQARRKAGNLTADVVQGIDPQAEKVAHRQEPTFGQLFERWVEIHAKPKLRTWRESERLHKTLLATLDGRRLSAIRRADVQALHAHIGKHNGHYAANRCLELVRGVFNKAEPLLGWQGENPARGIQRFREEARDRFLQGGELPTFFRSINQEPPLFRDFFLTCLLTGARRGNVLAMRWADIDTATGLWRIPGERSKNGVPIVVPLVDPALRLLDGRKATCGDSPWVFPSRSKSGHLEVVKSAWDRVLKRAGLSDLRPHDLRRSLASWMAIGGTSLHIVGKALGHTDPSATLVYARLTTSPVKEAMGKAAGALLAAANGKQPEVIDATASDAKEASDAQT